MLLLSLMLPGLPAPTATQPMVMLPGGSQLPAAMVHEATILANATLLLDDGRYLEVGSYRPLTVMPTVASSSWIGWAWAKAECIYDPPPSWPVCEPTYRAFTGYWNIPSAPQDPNHLLLFIFNGMQPIDNFDHPLLQPVLQWGNNGAFGGWYWSMASWFVTDYDEGIYSTPLLDVGANYDQVHGGMGWSHGTTFDITSTVLNSDCRAGYYSCPDTSLTVDTGYVAFGYISVVLEGWWWNGSNWDLIDNCDNLPGDIHFTGLKVVLSNGQYKDANLEEDEEYTICPGFDVSILPDGTSVDIATS